MDLIIGVYDGYNSLKTKKGGLFYFMKSLRKYNQKCKVVVLTQANNIFPELKNFSDEMNFEIFSDFVFPYEMMYSRLEIYKAYIEKSSYSKILIADMDDLVFQDDPFSIEFSEDLYCALEISIISDKTNSSSRLNMSWIDSCYHLRDVDYSKFEDKLVICAGTILGMQKGILNYLDFYSIVQSIKVVNDQGLLNLYVYNHNLCSKMLLPYTESKILTLDKIEWSSLDISDGIIYNKQKERYAILHQIDRSNKDFIIQNVLC
jgi:hypothetical protein